MAPSNQKLKLRALMVKHQETQVSMARYLGISINSFNRKINGLSKWNLQECKMIAEKFETSIDELFFG